MKQFAKPRDVGLASWKSVDFGQQGNSSTQEAIKLLFESKQVKVTGQSNRETVLNVVKVFVFSFIYYKMTFDDILKESGDFGPAQWCLLSLFSLVNIFSAFHYFAQTFITLTPVQECLNGSGSNASLPLHQSENYTDFVQNPELITREFLTLSTEVSI